MKPKTLASSLLVTLSATLAGCAGFNQTSSQVVIRHPGDHTFSAPESNVPWATADHDFAWLAEAAYGHTVSPEMKAQVAQQKTSPCADPEAVLHNDGWKIWNGFPNDGLLNQFSETNLRVEVWSRPNPPQVAVAFGGTVFTNWKDWIANLRWFIPIHDDEYTAVVKLFGPAFVTEFEKRKNDPAWSYVKDAKLYSAGHSLGGGLAQEFAYSLPPSSSVPRVAEVYAFDPSPVTGYFSVDSTIRDKNKEGLVIYRIYERGEILAYIRLVTNFFVPPPEVDPAVWTIRYAFDHDPNPIDSHSIQELACGMEMAIRGNNESGATK